MTELERQLTTALEKLSAQYETEQQRHSEQVEVCQQQVETLRRQVEQQAAESETLRRRVEQLFGQVTGLDADYRTLAETLRESWN